MPKKRITALPRREVKGIAIPWSINGSNHEGNSTTWTRRQKDGQLGPVGQYWKTGADGSFDKSVWVIEDDAPIVPTNIFLEEDKPELLATTSAELQVRFTTNTGEPVNGWDAYESNVILGETPSHYVMAVEFEGFTWSEWGNTDIKFQEAYGQGANNAVPKDGNLLLGWRLNTKNSPTVSPTANPWNPIRNLGAFDIESQSMFTINEAFERRLEDAQGKNYWLIPKSTVSEAILVKDEQSVLGYNELNLNPTHVLELTWMTPITKDPVLESTPMCRINFVQDGSTIKDILNRKDLAGLVRYSEAKGNTPAQVRIDFKQLSAQIATMKLRSNSKPRTGSFGGGTYKGSIGVANYVVGDSTEIKQGKKSFGYNSTMRLGGYRIDELGVVYKDSVATDVGTVPTVGAPWPGNIQVTAPHNELTRVRPNGGQTRVYNANVRNYNTGTRTVRQAPIKTSVGTLTINLDAIRKPPVKPTKGNIRIVEITIRGEQQIIMASAAR